jgi:ribosome-associated toxin RatA of RatAB toxin-antitoxin module
MARRIDNAIVIEAPMDLVWEMTNDVASWPQLFSEYAAAEILERKGDTLRFRLTLNPDEHGRSWSWVSERTPDPVTRTVTARRIETGPFEYMNIRWEYKPSGTGVEMRWIQEFKVRRFAPMSEDSMANRLQTNTVEQMARIKGLVEQEALSRKGAQR